MQLYTGQYGLLANGCMSYLMNMSMTISGCPEVGNVHDGGGSKNEHV